MMPSRRARITSPGSTVTMPIRIGRLIDESTMFLRNDGSQPRTHALNPSIFFRPSRSRAPASKTTPVPVFAWIALPRLSPIRVPSATLPQPSAM